MCVNVCACFRGCIFHSPLKRVHLCLKIMQDSIPASFPPVYFREGRKDSRKVEQCFDLFVFYLFLQSS